MKREHWPEVGWWRRRAWTEAWVGTAWAARRRSGCDVGLWWQGWKMGQRLASTEWIKGVGGMAAVRQRGESWRRGTATTGAGVGDGEGWWQGLGLATALALALVLSGDESLMRDEGWRERLEGWWAWWEMRELDEMMKKKKEASEALRSMVGLGIKEWIKEGDMYYFNKRIE